MEKSPTVKVEEEAPAIKVEEVMISDILGTEVKPPIGFVDGSSGEAIMPPDAASVMVKEEPALDIVDEAEKAGTEPPPLALFGAAAAVADGEMAASSSREPRKEPATVFAPEMNPVQLSFDDLGMLRDQPGQQIVYRLPPNIKVTRIPADPSTSQVPSLSMIDSAEQPFSAHNIPSTSEGATETTTNAIGLADIWKKLTEIDGKIDAITKHLEIVQRQVDNLVCNERLIEDLHQSLALIRRGLPEYVTIETVRFPVRDNNELLELEKFVQSEEGSLSLGQALRDLYSKSAYDLLQVAVENLFGRCSHRYSYTGRTASNSMATEGPLPAKDLHITTILLDTVVSKFGIDRTAAESELIRALTKLNSNALKRKRRQER